MSARFAKHFLLLLLVAICGIGQSAEAPDAPGEGYTPPRLSYIDGQASFWGGGAEDWTPARVNMPLAEGDRLYTGQAAALEIQVGARAFVRAADRTELGLMDLEPGFLQFELKGGTAALDLRSLLPGYRVELDTPNAVFTIEHPGYYRAEVNGDTTRFTTRRGGQATISVEGAPPRVILASEEIVVSGIAPPEVTTYVAPQPDAWDRWNYARADYEVEAVSARYVSPGVYGVGALDQYGRWRVVPDYGPVWVPDGVAPGWTPYSAGSWIWDRYYGWTWVDDAPWGWAPFHYGRWVNVSGYWAWAPGPVLARPVYAPALVAFFGLASGVSARIGIGGPGVGWVALGWGEPLRPWWGRPGFVGVPWWGGWGGPRVVNNVVIERTTVVNVNTIVYRNSRVPNGVVAVDEKHFGAGRIRGTRFTPRESHELEPIREAHPVRPGPTSHAAATGPATRPPPAIASRPVVTTRPPREAPRAREQEVPGGRPRSTTPAPPPRVVTPPKQPDATAALPRPSFGEKGPERPRPPQPPRYEGARKPAAAPPTAQPQREAAPARATRPAERPAQATAPRAPEPAATPPAAQPQREPTPPRAARPAESPAQATAPRAPEPVRQPSPQRAAPPAQRPAAAAAPPAAHTPAAAPAAKPPQGLPGRPANTVSPQRREEAPSRPGRSSDR